MIRIYPTVFSGKIKAPASKAHAQRLLFMSAMPTETTLVKNVPACDDIDTAADVLRALGCTVTAKGSDYTVQPFPKTSPMPEADLNFKESATTARLATALCGAYGIKARCRANGTLPRRKMVHLTSRMSIRGVTFSNFSLPYTQEGRLLGGGFEFAGNEGSQSISALMMFLPCLLADSDIEFSSPLVDRSYIDITRKSLEDFGIMLEDKATGGYHIPGRQYYQSPGTAVTENDWSLASMWITAAAACGERTPGLTVTGLKEDSPQQYRNISPVLALIRHDFRDVNIDASKMPNLTTLFCALAIVKGATVRISGVPQLHYKEADRLRAMADIALDLGQTSLVTDDSITIIGNGKPSYKEDHIVNCQRDPWVFMSMALAAATMKVPLILDNENLAEKVYRDFLPDYKSIGGKYEIIEKQNRFL